MYTDHTYQDWEAISVAERHKLLMKIIESYKTSLDFRAALIAQKYFLSENDAVSRKKLLKPQRFETRVKVPAPDGSETEVTKTGLREVEIEGNRVYSSFFFRIVTQENQHLLGNGVSIGDSKSDDGESIKARLGIGFDTTLQQLGEKAMIHGVCWGYWNHDHIEPIEAVKDINSGFVALVDEETSAPRLGVQFWRLSEKRPLYVRLFEEDGMTVYRTNADGELIEYRAKRPYVLRIARDAAGEQVIGTSNYSSLPLVPLYANPEKRSEFNNAIRSKVDAYDRISSDFVDNLDRANDIYWVLNNFGGNTAEIAEMIEQIQRIRAVVNVSDGMGGGSTAEPHTFEVPYAARQTALDILEKQIYEDMMALNTKEITGGSLTNVAIKASMTNLNLKCDRFEWQVFAFVQSVLRLIGVQMEKISFVRQTLVNQTEVVQDIATMRDYIDDETALRLNPYINEDEIPEIMERMATQQHAEAYSGQPSIEELDRLAKGVDA
ncbi:MAG: phage portal protein [Clostridia bacterium]|nr:phage portal protein [Clostridia bacterium]